MPCFAVLGDCHIQWAATKHCVIVNQQVSAVGQGDRVDPGVGMGQRGERHLAPSPAAVVGPDFEDVSLTRAAERLLTGSILTLERFAGPALDRLEVRHSSTISIRLLILPLFSVLVIRS